MQSTTGAAAEVFEALANKFCTALDLSKDSSSTLLGSASASQGADLYCSTSAKTADTCALGYTASYTQIVTTYKFYIFGSYLPIVKSTEETNRRLQRSSSLRGGELQHSCGTFEMSISSSAPAPSITAASPPSTPTLSPPVLQAQQRYGKNEFGRHSDNAANAPRNRANTS